MPINIPDALPAKDILESEKIFAIEDKSAHRQRIRPLKIVILFFSSNSGYPSFEGFDSQSNAQKNRNRNPDFTINFKECITGRHRFYDGQKSCF